MTEQQTPLNSNRLKDSIKKLDNQDLTRSGFWLAQLFTILATIVGVYLAAQAGLRQAIEFDDLQTRQNNYYLRSALYDEVKDNEARLRQYNENTLSKNLPTTTLKLNNPKIEKYIWETMKFSESTLSTPSFYLTETRRFYSNIEDIITKVESANLGAKFASKQLTTQLDHLKNQVLPKMKQDIEQLADYLKQQDIDVIEIKGNIDQ